ncbi:DUF2147 domain-containing protein [Francisellaceae bacterium]|nr:DUF2147 domain-containing protein [Francisellaceae bacterium]
MIKKISMVIGSIVMFSVTNLYANDTEIITRVSDAYSNNKVLNNEIQAIPGDAAWNDQGSSGVENGVLVGNSYWATVSNDKVGGKYVIQAILGITAKGKSIKGGVLVPFTNIQDDKALPPVIVCSECDGDMENKPVIGLPIINASLNKQNQYRGKIVDPLNGNSYNLAMWVNKQGTELNGAGQFLFFNTSQTWYRISNDLAKSCFEWFKKQPFSTVKGQSENQGKNFKSFAYAAEDGSTSDKTVTDNLQKLCQ